MVVAAIAIVGYIAYKLMQGMGGSSSPLPGLGGTSTSTTTPTTTKTSISTSHQAAAAAAAAFAPANSLGYSQRINNAQRLLFANRMTLFGWQR